MPRLIRIALAIAIVAVAQPLAVPAPSAYAAITGGYYSVAVRPEVSGTYATPYGIAVDSSGDVYVADTQNHRIKKVSPAGEVLAIWGSRGAAAGFFERPEGVAISADGRVFVADTGNNRVQVLAPDGQPLAVWNVASGLYRPTGLTFDSGGNLYVADTGKHRIVKFSPAGVQMAIIGSPGAGHVQFNGPHGLAVDATHLYVADTGNRRIQKLTLAGGYTAQWGPVEVSGTTYSRYGTPYGVSLGPGGSLFVVDLAGIKDSPANPSSAVYWVERCSNIGAVLNKWGTAGTGLGQYRTPGAVVARPGGGAYVADSGNNRIQVLDASGVATAQWSGAGSGNGELNEPNAAVIGPDGMTYVADTNNNRIQVFDAAGAYVRQWGGVSRPTDLVFDSAGDVWVVERTASRLARFSTDGTPLGTIGTGSLTAPEGIARAANGDLWVADTGGARLVRFAPTGGAPLQLIGPSFTGGPGTFAAPTDLAVAADGRLWVVDRDGARVLVFEPSGTFVTTFGSFGTSDGQFRQPTGIALGTSGQAYISDSGNARVQRFSSAGTHETSFGVAGAAQGGLAWPTRPSVMPDGRVLVPERDNHRLQVFAYDDTPPVTTASGIPGTWTNQDVTITLSATDAGAGVAVTYYRIGSGTVTEYTQPFVIDTDFNGSVFFWSVDQLGNTEASNSRLVRIDKTPPAGTFSLDGGAAFTQSATVTVSSSVTGGNEMRLDTGTGWGPWGPIWPTQEIVLPGQGVRRVDAQFRDTAGNVLSLANTITVDWTAPVTEATGVPVGWSTAPVEITLDATDAHSGVAQTLFRLGSDPFEAYDAPILIADEDDTVIEWYSIDAAGNVETTRTATVYIDSIPPDGQFMLAGGAAFVATTTVEAVSYFSDAEEMRFDIGAAPGSWESFETTVTLELPGSGVHNVNGRYRDWLGNESVYPATVTVDLAPPVTTAPSVPNRWVAEPVDVELSAVDDYSGVAATYYRIGEDGSTEVYASPFEVADEGTTTVHFWSVDNVGNLESTRTVDVRIDLTVPHGMMRLSGGATFVTTSSVLLESAVQGATRMRIDTGRGYGELRPYEQLITLMLPEGVHAIRVEYSDEVDDPDRVFVAEATIAVDFPPAAPQGVRVRALGNGWVDIDWLPAAETDVTSYVLWRQSGIGPWVPLTVLAHPVTTYRDAGLDGAVEYSYRVTARDLRGTEGPVSAAVSVTPSAISERYFGVDRYATALQVSAETFLSADAVVLATGASFADALGAAPLAGALGAPILLTEQGRLTDGVATEIARLGAGRVLVVGGPGAVGSAVDDALRLSLPGIEIERGFVGADRYETAALLAARTLVERTSSPEPGMVFVVRGDAFADALAVAPIAYSGRIPILLTRPTAVPASTINAIAAGGFNRAVVVGGTSAVPQALLPTLTIPSTRVSGPDRYATAAEFARWAFIGNLTQFSEVGLATGATFPDALGGGAALGSRGGVMLLTPPTSLAEPTRRALADYAHQVERITVFGGTSAISGDVRAKADAALW